jgi:gamma-glutamylputrescine oxidase
MLSFWEKDIFTPKYDFLIIGAGFTGLWMAYFLKQKNSNLKIAIIEKGVLPSGASTKNAGFACFGSPSELLENVKQIGWDKTLEMTQKRFEGIKLIERHFGKLINYNDCGASELFLDETLFQQANQELKELNHQLSGITSDNSHFKIDSEIIEKSGFEGFKFAISNEKEAAIHSGKLFHELYKDLISKNVNFFFGTTAEIIEENPNDCLITTNTLGKISTNHTIVCANAFSNKLLPSFQISPGRGQVLITKPIKNLRFNKTFHYDKGFYYFRNVGDRILIGGGRNLNFEQENTLLMGETKEVIEQLKKHLKEHILPNQAFEIDYTWSGIMAFNEQGSPYSEIISPKISINAGMNGMGVALAPYLSYELSQKLLR